MIVAPRDRIGGAVVLLIGIAIAIEARTFTVGFLTDPLGPKALPYLVAILLVVGGASLMLRPDRGGDWPDPTSWRRTGAAFLIFVVYAAMLPPFGFLFATWTCLVALGRLFGGPWGPNALASACFTMALYVVFAALLGLTLPVGSIFTLGPP